MNEQILHIGFDDTDSPSGMCTTFLAWKIIASIKRENVEFLDYPRLIRFNPNIPWKTRGNGAVALKIKTSQVSRIKSIVKNLVNRYADIKNGANPGLVFYESKNIPKTFTDFGELALWQLIRRNDAKIFAQKNKLDFFYRGNGQGLIGAIGAIGYKFDDHTLELLSYRKKPRFGTKRKLSQNSVKQMQKLTSPNTFNSYDEKKKHIMITPHGPDPVFYGIRGEKISSLLHATTLLDHDEKLAGHLIFKSNQGTGDHLKHDFTISTMKSYTSGNITGKISKNPYTTKGGHVIFQIVSKNNIIDCAVYKPTGITQIAKNLVKGDKIRIGGGIRHATKNHPKILNVEYIKIVNLKKIFKESNPLCKDCNKKMKSKGTHQGFQCIKCGKKSKKKQSLELERNLETKTYVPVMSAHRHLTRPLERIGRKNNNSKFQKNSLWFSIYGN